MLVNNSAQHRSEVADLFPQTKKEKDKRSLHQRQRTMKRKLGEVIVGQRPFLRVHSDTLQTDFWFINEGLVNPADSMFNGKVVTMEMLAEIMMARQPVLKTVEELFRDEKRYRV